ncbi:MAG: GNAT family N-acetyltransferase [Candidatus Rhabdochlamydia sp.]
MTPFKNGSNETIIQTERLILRHWKEDDLLPFALLNADPRVRKHFPGVLTADESHQLAFRIQTNITKRGWGYWAVSLLTTQEFIGFIGLEEVDFTALFTHSKPTIEIGWRLAFHHWSKGYATEGAKAALMYGFQQLHLPEIVAFTTRCNERSQNVMEKIGMTHDEELDFDHPKLSSDHPLKRHVLYKISSSSFYTGGSNSN